MDKKHILFGSGNRAERVLGIIGKNIQIAYVIDNDRAKWNGDFQANGSSYRVHSPDTLKNETLDDVEIIIGSVSDDEMLGQLDAIAKSLSKRLSARYAVVKDVDGLIFNMHIASFTDAGKTTLAHDYSLIDCNTLVFRISDKPCAIRFDSALVNGVETLDLQGTLETNGEWTDGRTIQFPNHNPTVYIENHNGIDTLEARFSFVETDYKKAYEFQRGFYNSLSDFSNNINPDFVSEEDHEPVEFGDNDVKPIAFYLPQFHKIPQNDEWWEKGFTEWTNVTKAYPLFEGHYQPHLPIDMGFYDLSNVEVQKRQIELAKKYGVYGFCYYYYQYENMKLLDAPLNRHLNNEELDFPFCVMWANENWTRVWSGDEKEILAEVGTGDEYYLRVIKDICVFLKDSRYIMVDGKPLIIIYHFHRLSNPKSFANLWREFCRKEGIGEIMLLYAKNMLYSSNPSEHGFDGVFEFFPFMIVDYLHYVSHRHPPYEHSFTGKILDHRDFVESKLYCSSEKCLVYKNVFPCWDNSPRYHNHAKLFHGCSPELYRQWLEDIIDYTKNHHKSKDKYVFVNAWNEWAEGAHLEPDRKYGYAYLAATREAVLKNIWLK